ncbi:MAG: hypothetical protein GF350_15065 [Chitinivibrionales bacterium]|nr:hypothetical protein [Chitinivibrionales bacterium]
MKKLRNSGISVTICGCRRQSLTIVNMRSSCPSTTTGTGGSNWASSSKSQISERIPIMRVFTLHCVMILGLICCLELNAQPPYDYTLTDLKNHLPVPVLENSDYIDLYWKAWELFAGHVVHNQYQGDFVEYYIDEAHSYWVFQWDTAFMLMFARYGYFMFPTIVSFDNFYRMQNPDGFICRQLLEKPLSEDRPQGTCRYSAEGDHQSSVNPPLFSWAEWDHYKHTGDTARLRDVLPYLDKFFYWIKNNRRFNDELYWSTGYGSGMDNLPIGWSSHGHAEIRAVCLTAQQALNALYMKKIADEIGDQARSAVYDQEYAYHKGLIARFWDDQDGFYYYLDRNGEFIRAKTLGGLWPLLALASEPAQNKKIVGHLTDPNEFWRAHVFPTVSADYPEYDPAGDYWRGSIWAPTNYMTIKALQYNGYDSLAREASINHLDAMSQVLKNTGTIWENYAPDTIAKGSKAREDFVGWSGLGPIANLIENVLGIEELDARNNTLTWRIARLDRHGIQRLRFGNITVNLLCEQRSGEQQPPHLSIETDNPVTVKALHGKKMAIRSFPAGSYQWTPDFAATFARNTPCINRQPHLRKVMHASLRNNGNFAIRALKTTAAIYSIQGKKLSEIIPSDSARNKTISSFGSHAKGIYVLFN